MLIRSSIYIIQHWTVLIKSNDRYTQEQILFVQITRWNAKGLPDKLALGAVQFLHWGMDFIIRCWVNSVILSRSNMMAEGMDRKVHLPWKCCWCAQDGSRHAQTPQEYQVHEVGLQVVRFPLLPLLQPKHHITETCSKDRISNNDVFVHWYGKRNTIT